MDALSDFLKVRSSPDHGDVKTVRMAAVQRIQVLLSVPDYPGEIQRLEQVFLPVGKDCYHGNAMVGTGLVASRYRYLAESGQADMNSAELKIF